ncbi:MAG: DoxX family membrane protein [Deltaproteobacteria bacterium]|nr:DoxX family membrane protein [Deltaproteobacteria bacterium]
MVSSFKLIKKIITHPYTALLCRIVLGVGFIYSSWDKILHPEQFAQSVLNYRVLPPESVNLLAIILPWLEIVCGIFLLLGLFTGGSILVIIFMVTVFLVAIGSALIRGIDISCGCFPSNGAHGINILYLLRDMTIFAFAIQVLRYDRRILSLDNLINKKDFP